MRMVSSILVIASLTMSFANGNFIASQDFSSHLKNGFLIEKKYGFPYKTYGQWLNVCKKPYTFDEDEFKKQFPPEDFDEYKHEIQCPFETYEQWLQALRNRFGHSQFDEEAFKENYPQKDFDRYIEEIDYMEIKYMSDGLEIVGFVLKPKKTVSQKLPVIIYNRGGNQNIGLLDFEKLYSFFSLVLEGYVLVASQYRGCGGSEGQDEIGGSDVNDVVNLLPLIEALPYADAARIGMFGWSRGGMMTYITLTKTDRISAAVIGGAPTDFLKEISIRPETEDLFVKLAPDYWDNKEGALRSRSAIYWPEKLSKKTPILILHGSADKRADPNGVLKMAELLYEMSHPFRFVFFEGGDHGLNQFSGEVQDLIIEWFNKYVRDSTAQVK